MILNVIIKFRKLGTLSQFSGKFYAFKTTSHTLNLSHYISLRKYLLEGNKLARRILEENLRVDDLGFIPGGGKKLNKHGQVF